MNKPKRKYSPIYSKYKVKQTIAWKGNRATKYKLREVGLTPMRAIKFKCLQCTRWNHAQVESCTETYCALHSYRGGKTRSAYKTDPNKAPKRQLGGMAAERLAVPKPGEPVEPMEPVEPNRDSDTAAEIHRLELLLNQKNRSDEIKK